MNVRRVPSARPVRRSWRVARRGPYRRHESGQETGHVKGRMASRRSGLRQRPDARARAGVRWPPARRASGSRYPVPQAFPTDAYARLVAEVNDSRPPGDVCERNESEEAAVIGFIAIVANGEERVGRDNQRAPIARGWMVPSGIGVNEMRDLPCPHLRYVPILQRTCDVIPLRVGFWYLASVSVEQPIAHAQRVSRQPDCALDHS